MKTYLKERPRRTLQLIVVTELIFAILKQNKVWDHIVLNSEPLWSFLLFQSWKRHNAKTYIGNNSCFDLAFDAIFDLPFVSRFFGFVYNEIIMPFFFVCNRKWFSTFHRNIVVPRLATVADLLNKILLTSKTDCSSVGNKSFVRISWFKMNYAKIMQNMNFLGEPQQANSFRSLVEQ